MASKVKILMNELKLPHLDAVVAVMLADGCDWAKVREINRLNIKEFSAVKKRLDMDLGANDRCEFIAFVWQTLRNAGYKVWRRVRLERR